MKRLSGDFQLSIYFLAGVVVALIGVTAQWGWHVGLIGLGASICVAAIWIGL